MKAKKRTNNLSGSAADAADRAKQRIAKVRTVLPPVAARFKKQSLQQQTEEALQNVPRITNETIAEHRENVLRGARKYKYPLEHSKRKIITVSVTLLVAAIITFFSYSVISLYKLQSTSTLMYRITQLIPFPVAKAGSSWVSYENYLFELRRYMHYYQTQQQVDFKSEKGKLQLAFQKPKVMQQIIDAAYVNQLAQKNGVSVEDSEIRDALDNLRVQSQLSDGDRELSSIVSRFYGWSLDDLKRELKINLLAQKVAAKLDTEDYARTQSILLQIRNGADFATVANQSSDDVGTKGNGGLYNDQEITFTSQEVPIQVVRKLAGMKAGDVSDIITTPTSFEIVKLVSIDNGKYKAAHIQIHIKPVSTYTDPLEKAHPPKKFIAIPAAPTSVIPTQGK